jgi:hypothetical protein
MADRTQRYRGKDYGKFKYLVPTSNDVLCGKDRATFSHLGNRRFRYIISMNAASYVETKTKRERSFMVGAIVSMIQEKGARFVKKDPKANMYYEICTEHARDKVAHALRDTCARVSKFKEASPVPPPSKEGSKSRSRSSKGAKSSEDILKESMDQRLQQVSRTVDEASMIDSLPLRTAVPHAAEGKSPGWNALQVARKMPPPFITPPRANSPPPSTSSETMASTAKPPPRSKKPPASSKAASLKVAVDDDEANYASSPPRETRMAASPIESSLSSFMPYYNVNAISKGAPALQQFGRFPPTWDHAFMQGALSSVPPQFHPATPRMPMPTPAAFIPHQLQSELLHSPFTDTYAPLPLQPLPLEDLQHFGPTNVHDETSPMPSPMSQPDVVPANEADLEPWPAHLGNDHPR